MRTTDENQMQPAVSRVEVKEFSYNSEISYHEMAEVPVREVSQLDQLQANLNALMDVNGRMKFMMREIRYMMKV